MLETTMTNQPGFMGSVSNGSGIHLLAPLDVLIVKQKKEPIEYLTDYESRNKYEVMNRSGHLLFLAEEDTSFGARMCFGNDRPFLLNIITRNKEPIMQVGADYDCCGQTVTVQVPPGQVAANIRKEYGFVPNFFIDDAAGAPLFQIKSSASAVLGSLGDVEFAIESLANQNHKIGQITKQYRGFMTEAFTDADSFAIEFPVDMEVKWKAVLLGALFHIDFAFYEK